MRRLTEAFGFYNTEIQTVLQENARIVNIPLLQVPREYATRMTRAMLHTICVCRRIGTAFTPSELLVSEIDFVYVAIDDPKIKIAIEDVLDHVKTEQTGYTVIADIAEPDQEDPTKAYIFEQWRINVVFENSNQMGTSSSSSSSSPSSPCSSYHNQPLMPVNVYLSREEREVIRKRFIATMDNLSSQLLLTDHCPNGSSGSSWLLRFSYDNLPFELLQTPSSAPSTAVQGNPIVIGSPSDAPAGGGGGFAISVSPPTQQPTQVRQTVSAPPQQAQPPPQKPLQTPKTTPTAQEPPQQPQKRGGFLGFFGF